MDRNFIEADIYNVLESDFSKPYNPLHEYLYSLPEWTEEQPDYKSTWFNNAEIKILARHNREFQAPCMEEELIPLYFRKPGPEECGQFFSTALVMKYIGDYIGSKLNVVKVGMAMAELGFKGKKHNGMKGWICVPIVNVPISARLSEAH